MNLLIYRIRTHTQTAKFAKSATRFIAACSVASKPKRLTFKVASSAFTITCSKNASTGACKATSV